MNYRIFFFISLFTLTIQAQWSQVGIDIDGESAGDYSGKSISLSGDGSIVAIGASSNDGNGANSGHVRIFENQSGTWEQIGEDIEGDESGDSFGSSVSLSSDGTVVAVESSRIVDGEPINYVRVLENQGGIWTQIGSDIVGSVDYFYVLSIDVNYDGTFIVINGIFAECAGAPCAETRIYQIQGGSWTQIGDTITSGGMMNGSVSINEDGSVVAIGLPNYDGYYGSGSGSVVIYENQSNSWVQIGSYIDGEAAQDNSGYSVSLNADGTRLAIGAPSNDGEGSTTSAAGHVRVFDNISGVWTQVGEDIDGGVANGLSGSSVSMNSEGNRVAVGIPGYASGRVRLYEYHEEAWVQIGAVIVGEATDDRFGSDVSVSSDGLTVAIGAPYNDGNGSNSGHVRVFQGESLGVDNQFDFPFFLYPNPVSDRLYINYQHKIDEIQIYNNIGQIVLKQTHTKSIDIHLLNKGLYFCKIFDVDRNISISKFIKK